MPIRAATNLFKNPPNTARVHIIIKDQYFKTIVKNAAIILSGNSASSALGFISFAILASTLGPEALGIFALAQVYTGITNSLFNVQTWESMIKFGAKDDDKTFLANTIKTNLLIDILSAAFAFIFAISALNYITSLFKWDQQLVDLAFLYCFTIPFTITTFTIGLPRLFNKFYVVAKIQFIFAALKLALVFFISLNDGSIKAFLLAYIFVEIMINLSLITLSLRLTKKNSLNWLKAKVQLSKEQIKFLWWTNLRTIVRIPVRQLDLLIINQIMTVETVGIYKAYKEVVSIIARLGEPINQAIFPEYSKLLGKDKSSETVAVTKKIMLLLLALSAATIIFFYIASNFIIETFLGVEYLSLITVFYILVVLNSINLFLTPVNSLFVAAGFARYGFYIVLFNNVLYLLIALLGGMLLGIYGIVLAFATQLAFNQGAKIFFLRKYSTGWSDTIR